jgi:hypothetical protein
VKRTGSAWDSVIPLVESLRRSQEPQREKLKRIVSRSSKRLWPLVEPLLVDSPLIKMLGSSREEAYSDWLAWCLERLGPLPALNVLGVDQETTQFRRDDKFEIKREYSVASGDEGSSGRLDLRVLVGGREIADVEVKLGDADKAYVDKHEGYAKSGVAARVLLATAGSLPSYRGFKLREWRDVCLGLRREACALVKERKDKRNVLMAGWILEFVAAVEETLLRVPGPVFRAICNRDEPRILSQGGHELEHLEKWIDSEDGDDSA